LKFVHVRSIKIPVHIGEFSMPKILENSKEIENLLQMLGRELDMGQSLTKLPLNNIDWNGTDGRLFLKSRISKGDGENIINNLRLFRLKDEATVEILVQAVAKGVHMTHMPAVQTFSGGEEKCKRLWDKIIECKRGKEYLELLRSHAGGDRKLQGMKLHAYDYVVEGYKRKGFDKLPESKVIFGKFEEEDKEDEQREKVKKEQQLIGEQQLTEEQKRKALEKHRRSLVTPVMMKSLTKELKGKGILAVNDLWRANALGVLGHYADADDVKDFPEFLEALTAVVDDAVEKGFEAAFRCVLTFPLIYGSEVRYGVPPVIKKAFDKYPATMLKAIEKKLAEKHDPRGKRDYFFFTKVAVTNPAFDWEDINLGMMPEAGVTIYNDNDEAVVLSLREQLEEFVISANEAGVKDSIPKKYANYDYDRAGVLEVLADWIGKDKRPEEKAVENVEDAKGILSFIMSIFGRKKPVINAAK